MNVTFFCDNDVVVETIDFLNFIATHSSNPSMNFITQ